MLVAASILAGGTGRRISAPVPKQFLEIYGKPILEHTLEVFLDSNLFQLVAVAIHPEWKDPLAGLLERHGWTRRVSVVEGGATRQASSCAVLQSFRSRLDDSDIVLIHDAARCLADQALLERCVESCKSAGAVTSAIPVVDTIARTREGKIAEFPPREVLYSVQTPQAFRFGWILEAHRQALARGVTAATDDARLVLDEGREVHIVAGSPENLKVSNPLDLALAEILLRRRSHGRDTGGHPTG